MCEEQEEEQDKRHENNSWGLRTAQGNEEQLKRTGNNPRWLRGTHKN